MIGRDFLSSTFPLVAYIFSKAKAHKPTNHNHVSSKGKTLEQLGLAFHWQSITGAFHHRALSFHWGDGTRIKPQLLHDIEQMDAPSSFSPLAPPYKSMHDRPLGPKLLHLEARCRLPPSNPLTAIIPED